MTNQIASLAARLASVERRLDSTSRTAQLAYSSIENGAIDVFDEDGSLRAVIGQQPDGTTGLNVVNGPPPPQPTAPTLTPSIGGVTVGWDGRFTDGSPVPLDWARLEIHASEVDFVPNASTLRATIESPQGGTFTIVAEAPVYVRMVARNTSGTASPPSPPAGPLGRMPVVAEAVLDGIVGELALAEAAVSRSKIAIGAVDADRMAVGTGNLLPDASFEGAYTENLVAASPVWQIAGPGNNSARCLAVDTRAAAPTTHSLQITTLPASPGDRFFLAIDYRSSADWFGLAPKFYLCWQDAAGVAIGYGVVQGAAAPVTAWTRMSGQVQAPANTVRATVWIESFQANTGNLSFDNAEVRTVITAGVVLAGAISGDELAANSITGEKVVAQTITGREVKFRSLTGDHLDVNSARIALLTSGVITADMLTADALNGKTITGGHIIGVEIDGAALRTADTGSRVEITSVPATDTAPSSGRVRLYSGSATEVEPASMYSLYDAATNTSTLHLQSAVLNTPALSGVVGPMSPTPDWPTSAITMWSEPSTAHLNLSATEAKVDAVTTVIGSAPYYQVVVRSGVISAQTSAGVDASLYLNRMLGVDPSGWISRSNEDWKSPTLSAGWTHYGGSWDRVAYKIYPDRTVGLRGLVKRTSKDPAAGGEVVIALPASARPTVTNTQQFSVLVPQNGSALTLNINPSSGTVTLANITSGAATALASGSAYLNLSGIRFPLD
ncbi:hypothetical protein [Streptomyces asiaticus]|uniref:hypothetical protein n=1 Tax=Streptomyces asiaticus TaxID=114695 RepID=UPI003F67BA0D